MYTSSRETQASKSGDPIVSVIIPTYIRAHVLAKAIQSLLNQTYQDFEIIVVDDGSIDNTEEVVKSFNDPRIRYIRHKENCGGSAARNTGIRAAYGECIAFQDSDDEWLPEKLEKQMQVFENAPAEVGVVYTGFRRIQGRSKAGSEPTYCLIEQEERVRSDTAGMRSAGFESKKTYRFSRIPIIGFSC